MKLSGYTEGLGLENTAIMLGQPGIEMNEVETMLVFSSKIETRSLRFSCDSVALA